MAGRGSDRINSVFLSTEIETILFAKEFAHTLEKGDIIALHGELGAGKTTFVKAVVASLSHEKQIVQSPTFTYLHIYDGPFPIYHFDLYRLANEQAFLEKGFLDFLSEGEGVCLIEWPDRIKNLLPKQTRHIHLEHEQSGGRTIAIS